MEKMIKVRVVSSNLPTDDIQGNLYITCQYTPGDKDGSKVDEIKAGNERMKDWIVERIRDVLIEYIEENLPQEVIDNYEDGDKTITLPVNCNILDEMQCPECGSAGPFYVNIQTIAEVDDEGIDYDTEVMIDGKHNMLGSFVKCECDHTGIEHDFKLFPKNRYAVKYTNDAFGIARIGKDQMYESVEELVRQKYGVQISIDEMTMTPAGIEDDEVIFICEPTSYTVEGE